MKDLPQRKNIRLKDYDYSQNGTYFITICVKNRHELLGKIVGAGSTRPSCKLSKYGKIVRHNIEILTEKYSGIKIEKYVIMPNHIHLIIVINGRVNPAPTLSQIIGYLKYQTTKEIGVSGFWQRSYHDHIIRNEVQYQKYGNILTQTL